MTTSKSTVPSGIIPARAGFTRRSVWPRPRTTDHPRSRGVYHAWGSETSGGGGSSPLARGLHDRVDDAVPDPGIIPARAGFTRRSGTSGRCPGDHPRSRGVYFGQRAHDPAAQGSSPLARGLPRHLQRPRTGSGIIPARAGFTPARRRRGRGMGDHPRSRGVYSTAATYLTVALGSSPLARGLPGGQAEQAEQSGIIPARAGFTGRPTGTSNAPGDHPRSRGVYRAWGLATWAGGGSSPLARGLRRGLRCGGVDVRIIPARAGFTRGRDGRVLVLGDHPRSRGVYDGPRETLLSLYGSSPLARGLRFLTRGDPLGWCRTSSLLT